MGSHKDRKVRQLTEFTLTPALATGLFVIACLAGMRYRSVWKAEGPRSRLWLYGGIAAVALLVLGFVPMRG